MSYVRGLHVIHISKLGHITSQFDRTIGTSPNLRQKKHVNIVYIQHFQPLFEKSFVTYDNRHLSPTPAVLTKEAMIKLLQVRTLQRLFIN